MRIKKSRRGKGRRKKGINILEENAKQKVRKGVMKGKKLAQRL